MKKLLESLTISQLEKLQTMVENELADKIAISKEHKIRIYLGFDENSLKSLKRDLTKRMNTARNNKEYEVGEFEVNCINRVLEIKENLEKLIKA